MKNKTACMIIHFVTTGNNEVKLFLYIIKSLKPFRHRNHSWIFGNLILLLQPSLLQSNSIQ